ncbi:hypothetical protein [Bradyrhizobium sp. SYSU BS000235]|uniref:hypothetical protein n=1 Tax=Bradyrhizobium sp. SYSU BS000235 TaxID=3411332 RepID=UPI003C76CC20
MRNRVTVATWLVLLLGLIAGVEQPVAQPAPSFGVPPPYLPGFGPPPQPPQVEAPPVRRVEPPPLRRAEAPRARRAVVTPRTTQRKPRVVRRAQPQNLRKVAEDKGFKRVSDLVNFPKFFPGLGVLFVKPDTLPLGPFLCFDRKDRLMATVYMVPMTDLNDHKTLEAPAFAGRTDHVSIYFNAGHPGVEMPHYHFVIWHVSKTDEERVAK